MPLTFYYWLSDVFWHKTTRIIIVNVKQVGVYYSRYYYKLNIMYHVILTIITKLNKYCLEYNLFLHFLSMWVLFINYNFSICRRLHTTKILQQHMFHTVFVWYVQRYIYIYCVCIYKRIESSFTMTFHILRLSFLSNKPKGITAAQKVTKETFARFLMLNGNIQTVLIPNIVASPR